MKLSILLHGYFGMGNVGDEAILSALIDEYRHLGYEPIALSANPMRTMKLHGVRAYREKFSSPKFWAALVQCSKLVFAGGGKYGIPTLRRLALLTIIARVLGKDVEYRGVGLYPYNWHGGVTLYPKPPLDPLTKYQLKLALRCAKRVTVRDIYSKKFIEGSIIDVEAPLELDPALKLKPDIRTARRALEALGLSTNDTILGLNLRFLKNSVFSNILYTIVKALGTYLGVNKHIKVLYIPFGYGSTPERFFDDDIRIGHLVAKHLPDHVVNSQFCILEDELRPSIILGLFKFLKAIICVRYHALVFAYMCRVPVLAIAYDTKVMEFAELMEKCGGGIRGLVVKPEDVSA
ncbi:MAG: hypothetical protein DRZ82_10040, partial [Thermoprotei archaeon]